MFSSSGTLMSRTFACRPKGFAALSPAPGLPAVALAACTGNGAEATSCRRGRMTTWLRTRAASLPVNFLFCLTTMSPGFSG
jgi:poly(3-hydroxybutyrate) depolymerase